MRMQCRLMQKVLVISLWALKGVKSEILDDSTFHEPRRPPFRNGWTLEERDVPILCNTQPNTENLMIHTWPLPPLPFSYLTLPNSPNRSPIDSVSKPNPDAIPICDAWRSSSSSDQVTGTAGDHYCQLLCKSRLSLCYFRPQFWKWYEWRGSTDLMGKGSTGNWNGPFDCVAEDLLGKCAGPCRSMSQLSLGSPCVVPRDQCYPTYINGEVDPDPESTESSSPETIESTAAATMEATTTETTTTAATITDAATTATAAEETTTVGEEGGWTSGEIVGSAVVSAGGAAIGVGACCRCSGGTAQMAGAPGIKDFGAAIGGGADDVARMAVEQKERKEDRMGNKEAMEAELAARMSVAMTISDQPSQLLSGKTAMFSSTPLRQ
eukprot:Protomagalhaensia_sp_Gyna_25__736@NODE_134_length_4981_cov_115_469446_g106_i0_p2_GENE_NODE_134_length_4981_cov_115_469446_g106_i0NODE_134_length_4981_cov_115_469446_g106_i0_p2_ORF_typecomplete_len380_score49_29Podoplanin/PF05808_11/0_00089MGC24/PF05283_11/0_005Alpha_GJ/PF03229_13/0_028_NODE_134_length_4981_cov_115_469446_g106_i029584097